MPWKWISVGSGSSLCSTIRTRSPRFARIVGPGMRNPVIGTSQAILRSFMGFIP